MAVQIPPELRYKFSPQLLQQLGLVVGGPVKVTLVLSPGANLSDALATLSSVGARVTYQSQLTNQITVIVDDAALPTLASLGTIQQIYHVPQGMIQQMPRAGIEPFVQGIAAVTVTLEDTTNYIQAPRYWDQGFRGAGVKIGIIDTGIDDAHPMLKGKVVLARNFSTATDTSDTNGHGTWCASAVAGAEWMSPDGPMIGVAPDAVLVNAKAFDGENADMDHIMAALEWAALQGCQVLSNSWGGEDYPPLHILIQAIRQNTGAVVVAAAGNTGPSPGTIQFPGGYAEVIAVGSIAIVAPAPDQVASFSSRGPAPGNLVKPDVVAPGGSEEECIYGAIPGASSGCYRGTSMATPHVAGAIALLVSAGKPPVPTVRSLGPTSNEYGYGALSMDSTAVTPQVTPGVTAFPIDFMPLVGFAAIAAVIALIIGSK